MNNHQIKNNKHRSSNNKIQRNEKLMICIKYYQNYNNTILINELI